MPRGTTEVLLATKNKVVLKTKVGKSYKITIPVQVRNLIEPNEERIITLQLP